MSKKFIKDTLKKFDFVMWDRFVEVPNCIQVYGWIDRKNDSYKDFILLVFKSGAEHVGYITSSPTAGVKARKILGIRVNKISKCQRVEKTFPVKNCIKLK